MTDTCAACSWVGHDPGHGIETALKAFAGMNLKELSNLLGLSQTTVSRALNGYPEVSEKTRLRVQEAARLHNYSPNIRAKGLATGRTHAIGHVITVSSKHEMVNPIFGDFIAGAAETYSQHGYELMLSLVRDVDEAQAYRDLAAKATVDGIIVHGPRINDPRIPLLNAIGLPFVVHGRSSDCPDPYSWVDVNNKRAMQRATEFLLDLGHRRIGLINGIEEMDFAIRRRSGFLAALDRRGLTADPALMHASEMTEIQGHEAAQRMLRLDRPPTALVVSSMIGALGVRRAIEERGLVLGRDVSVIAHDDDLSYLRNGAEVPIYTSTRSSVREAGQLAAEMLLERIRTPGQPPQSLMLEADLVVGQSTGPAPR